jgi:hypothetical protein
MMQAHHRWSQGLDPRVWNIFCFRWSFGANLQLSSLKRMVSLEKLLLLNRQFFCRAKMIIFGMGLMRIGVYLVFAFLEEWPLGF